MISLADLASGLRRVAAASLPAALLACAEVPTYSGRVVVDLNRTACGAATLTSVLADSAWTATLTPDVNGVYSFVSDTLPTGLYVFSLDSAHRLPMVVRTGRGQKVCGTVRKWEALTMSDSETSATFAAELLRIRLAVACDSALTSAPLTTAEGRRRVADSLSVIRDSVRMMADLLLAGLADSSFAALPLMGLPAVYADDADNDILLRRMTALSLSMPECKALALRRDFLSRVSRLNALRAEFQSGRAAPDFVFITEAGDSISSSDLPAKSFALVFWPDSASTPAKSAARVGLLASGGVKVFVEAADAKAPLPAKNAVRGRFARLDARPDLLLFRPVTLLCGKDGTVERLTFDN